MNALDVLKAGAIFHDHLAREGFTTEYVDDFASVPEKAKQTGRDFQMPGLSTVRLDHTQGSAFWLFLKDGDEYIGGVAAAYQDIGRERLDHFLKRTANNHFPHPSGTTILEVAKPIGDELNGKLAYIGELHFKLKNRGQRKILKSFMRLLQLLVVVQWDIDWMYAFIPNRHMEARLDLIHGFTRAIPHAQQWNEPCPKVRSSDEWFVAISRADLEHVISVEARANDRL